MLRLFAILVAVTCLVGCERRKPDVKIDTGPGGVQVEVDKKPGGGADVKVERNKPPVDIEVNK